MLITLGILAYYGTYKTVDICPVCGQYRAVRQFQIPGTTTTLFTRTSQWPSAVGDVLTQANLVDEHEHRWKTVFTVGNGHPLTNGDGQAASNVFESSQVTSYVQSIAGFQSHAAIAKYLVAAQNEVQSRQDGVPVQTTFVNETLIEPTTRKIDASDVITGRKQ